MRVLVTGGKGGLGREVVEQLRNGGHHVLVGTRTPEEEDDMVFTLSGDIPDLRGVDTVVHLASQPRDADLEVEGSEALFGAAAVAGVGHVLFMSIVGIDDHPFPYYRAKLGVEEALVASDVPWTILRSTQFHGFVPRIVDGVARIGFVPLPSGIGVQPIDRAVVADRIVELVESGPSGRVPDMGGPETLDLIAMARRYLRARGRRVPVVPIPMGGKIVAAFRQGLHHTPNRDHRGRTYGEYLASLASRPQNPDPAAGLLRLSGALLMLTVLLMLANPGFFHQEWAGFGPFNPHFIRDAATFGVPMAAALWLAAGKRSWRRPVLGLGLLQNGLHIVNHIVDVGASSPGWQGPVNLALLTVFQIVMWTAWRLDAGVRSEQERVEVVA